jgi:hypothetical protein
LIQIEALRGLKEIAKKRGVTTENLTRDDIVRTALDERGDNVNDRNHSFTDGRTD